MNYLYGKLNKELEYVKYSGEDTDTVNITVDNTDNTFDLNEERINNSTYIDLLKEKIKESAPTKKKRGRKPKSTT